MPVIPVPTHLLQLDRVVSFDLYVKQGDRLVLWRSKDYPLEQQCLDQLKAMGQRTVYVRQQDREVVDAFLSARIEQVAADDTMTVARRAETLFESCNAAVRRLAEAPSPKSYETVLRLSGVLAEFVRVEEAAWRELFALAGKEMHDYTHGTHVAALAVSLARRGGFEREETDKLALACLVRDLGMGRLPPDVREARGKLSAADLEIVKDHVRHSRATLEDAGASEPTVRTIVLQHHERADGSGYPSGLTNDEVEPLSRIASIADCYGALLTRRPYREPMTAFEALKLMLARQAGKFDDGWMKILIGTLSKE